MLFSIRGLLSHLLPWHEASKNFCMASWVSQVSRRKTATDGTRNGSDDEICKVPPSLPMTACTWTPNHGTGTLSSSLTPVDLLQQLYPLRASPTLAYYPALHISGLSLQWTVVDTAHTRSKHSDSFYSFLSFLHGRLASYGAAMGALHSHRCKVSLIVQGHLRRYSLVR